MERVLVESQGLALPDKWTRPDANGTLPLWSHWSISHRSHRSTNCDVLILHISAAVPKQ